MIKNPKENTTNRSLNKGFDVFERHFDSKLQATEDRLEEKINHLPTKEEFFSKMDQVVGELKNLREEVSLTHHHYEKTNKRVDKIDKHLGIDTSVVF